MIFAGDFELAMPDLCNYVCRVQGRNFSYEEANQDHRRIVRGGGGALLQHPPPEPTVGNDHGLQGNHVEVVRRHARAPGGRCRPDGCMKASFRSPCPRLLPGEPWTATAPKRKEEDDDQDTGGRAAGSRVGPVGGLAMHDADAAAAARAHELRVVAVCTATSR